MMALSHDYFVPRSHFNENPKHPASHIVSKVKLLIIALAATSVFVPAIIWPSLLPRFPLGYAADRKFLYEIGVCETATADALNITIYQDVPLAPSPLPPSHAASDGEAIIELFQNLSRTTTWKSIANISFEGDTFEPEGLVRLGPDRFVVSSGEYTELTKKYPRPINGTDRTPGKGFAHLMVFNGKGERIADATITNQGATEYHNGGIDYDGQSIWGAVSQYRPNSTAYVYKTSPSNLKPKIILRHNDHLGGVVHNTVNNSLTTLNWGSRDAFTWALNKVVPDGCSTREPQAAVQNPSYFVDYQDCKWLGQSEFYRGTSVMLCSGVAALDGQYHLGGIALVDVQTMRPLAEVPIMLQSALGVRMTQNPVDVSVEDGKLRFYWLPDQRNSTLYVYEAA
ncbi:uncharacterized protein TrAFT101_011090 [Trichoderma asperellum]|uniref:uncharacterized protein n=1 Tax=Trichoderma asperellum TaxID=101201 RepID=UPI00332FFEFA|nr:hypothetical protein TrAFT101_011090 [Trichoderma asperellum]